MLFPSLTWVLFLVAAVLCAVGFYKFSYLTTVGHGLAVGGLGLTVLTIALSRDRSSLVLVASCLLCLVYGLFQGAFTALGELLKSSRRPSYKSAAENDTPWYVSLCIWLGMTVLSVLQIAPLWYRTASGVGRDSVISYISLIFMLSGVVILLLAHRQGARQQQEDPSFPPMKGLYAWVRCPAQLGRILFWIGLLLGGAGFLSGLQWILAFIGFASAIFLAVMSARRQDLKIRRKYHFLPEYREYAEDTHILIPLLMSRKIKWEEEE